MKQMGLRSHIFAIFLLPFSYGLGAIGLGGRQLVDFFFERGRGGGPSFTILIHL